MEIIKGSITHSKLDLKSLAAALHRRWRLARKIVPGKALDGLEKREEHWHFANPQLTAGEPFDIANLSFEQLPIAWQRENIMAAEQALAVLNTSGKELSLEAAAAAVHSAWLKRHWPVDKKLQPIYQQLSEDEKEKDVQVIKESLKNIASSDR